MRGGMGDLDCHCRSGLCSHPGGVCVAYSCQIPVVERLSHGKHGGHPDPSGCLRRDDVRLGKPQSLFLFPGKQMKDEGCLIAL